MVEKKNTRREFIKSVAAGSAAAAAIPTGSSASIRAEPLRGRDSAAEKIVVGIMGTNGRGRALARGFAELPGADVAYICDVDQRAIDKGFKIVQEAGAKTPKGVSDFRRILDDRSVDALAIAAPDHWHAPATVLACQAGKHVYVEKPCSHNGREGELMLEAARKHQRVVQMGNQRRSWATVQEAITQVHSGLIGRVYYSRAWYANDRESTGRGHSANVPSWLDHELWQGPAPRRTFRENLVHYKWHWFWHWGTGELGNNGVHAIDLSRWGLDVDYPVRVTSSGGRFHWQDDQETPDTHLVTYEFPGKKSISWEGLSCNGYGPDGSGFGVTFHGEKGTLRIAEQHNHSGSGYMVYDREGNELRRVAVPPDLAGANTAVHLTNFMDAIRQRGKLTSDIEEGHKSTLLCHLGNIAQRTGGALDCNSANGRPLHNKEAIKLWSREYEPGWEPKV